MKKGRSDRRGIEFDGDDEAEEIIEELYDIIEGTKYTRFVWDSQSLTLDPWYERRTRRKTEDGLQ